MQPRKERQLAHGDDKRAGQNAEHDKTHAFPRRVFLGELRCCAHDVKVRELEAAGYSIGRISWLNIFIVFETVQIARQIAGYHIKDGRGMFRGT